MAKSLNLAGDSKPRHPRRGMPSTMILAARGRTFEVGSIDALLFRDGIAKGRPRSLSWVAVPFCLRRGILNACNAALGAWLCPGSACELCYRDLVLHEST